MKELGKKKELFGVELLESLKLHGRPTAMPILGKDERVICGYDQGLGERMIVCENLEEMQKLDDSYARGGARRICWYKGPDPGSMIVL